jgi:hypothetical protein
MKRGDWAMRQPFVESLESSDTAVPPLGAHWPSAALRFINASSFVKSLRPFGSLAPPKVSQVLWPILSCSLAVENLDHLPGFRYVVKP